MRSINYASKVVLYDYTDRSRTPFPVPRHVGFLFNGNPSSQRDMMDGPDHFVCPAYCTLLHRIIKPKLMLVPIKFAEPSDVCQKWGRGGAKI